MINNHVHLVAGCTIQGSHWTDEPDRCCAAVSWYDENRHTSGGSPESAPTGLGDLLYLPAVVVNRRDPLSKRTSETIETRLPKQQGFLHDAFAYVSPRELFTIGGLMMSEVVL